MTVDLVGWQDENLLDHRRRLRTGMFVSLAAHGLILALFAISPPSPVAVAHEYLAVDLVAAPPAAAAPAPARAPAPPAPAAPPPPAETAAPEPPPVAPAPIAEAPVQVLPEETASRIKKVKPDPPKVVAKVQPKPKPEPVVRRKREAELSYEAAMAQLGLDETSEALVPAPSSDVQDAQSDSPDSAFQNSSGVKVSPEQLAWDRAVSRLIQQRFHKFSRYEGRGLVTQVEVEVSASGVLAGEPKLIQTSGDMDFDRMIIAVVERAAPLPPPPKPGVRRLNLKSDQ